MSFGILSLPGDLADDNIIDSISSLRWITIKENRRPLARLFLWSEWERERERDTPFLRTDLTNTMSNSTRRAAIISNSSRVEKDFSSRAFARRPCRSLGRKQDEEAGKGGRGPHHTRGTPGRRGITQRAPAVTSFLRSVYNVLSTRVASLLAFRCIINDRLALHHGSHLCPLYLSLYGDLRRGLRRDFFRLSLLSLLLLSLFLLVFVLLSSSSSSPASLISPSRPTSVSWMHSDFPLWTFFLREVHHI